MSIRFDAWHYPPHRRGDNPYLHWVFAGFDHWWEALYLKRRRYHKHETLYGTLMVKFFAKELKEKSYREIMKTRPTRN